jgi:hypothetical protein
VDQPESGKALIRTLEIRLLEVPVERLADQLPN